MAERRGDTARLLRRSTAGFLAAVALWLLSVGAGEERMQAAARELGGSGAFVTTLLRLELGQEQKAVLPFWQRLAVEQSALLAANPPRGETAEEPSDPIQADQGEDDETEAPAPATKAEEVVGRTLIPTATSGYITGGGLYLYNRTDLTVDLAEALERELDLGFSPAEEGPQILILHTHGSEAYTPDGTDTYVASDNNNRTLDNSQNVVRIGSEMAQVFQEMGFSVLHDEKLYDYPQYNGAYSRSGAAMEQYLKDYPTIRLVLDVHRDALVGGDGTVYKPITTCDGAQTAQVMLVVGTDNGKGGHPNWEQNLSLAAHIQKNLDTLYPTLARPIALRSSIYNQSQLPGALLVEVGSHGNTLEEALSAARRFARAAGGAVGQ